MELPLYKLVGNPIKLKRHKQWTTNYYQIYRLLPSRRRLRAPCCTEKQTAKRKAIQYVEQHIRKSLRDPVVIHAATTITEHLKVYQEGLEADHCNPKYIKHVLHRIKRTCKLLKWRLVSDMDGLQLKTWISKQKLALKTAKVRSALAAGVRHLSRSSAWIAGRLTRTIP